MTIQGRHTVDVQSNIREKIELAEARRRRERFEHSYEAMLAGDQSVLSSAEFVSDLTNILVSDPDEDRARKKECLLALQASVVSENAIVRERVLALSSVVSLHFLRFEDFEFLSILVDGLLLWLEMETEIVPGLEQIFKRLGDCVRMQINHGRLDDAKKIIRVLDELYRQSSQKHRSFSSLSGKVLHDLAVSTTLEPLCDIAIVRDDDFPDARELLLLLGSSSVEYLFRRLVESPNKKERLQLIPLIAGFNEQAIELLEKRLATRPSWSEIRNILTIFGEIAHSRTLYLIRGCLVHEEKRVRIQALDCLRRIGGEDVKQELIKGLIEVDDGMKIQLIRTLVEDYGNDDDIFEALIALTNRRANFGASSGLRLLHALIGGFKRFPREGSVQLLKRMRSEYAHIPDQEEILFLIDQTMKFIEPTLRRKKADRSNEDDIGFDFDPMAQQGAFHCWKEIEDDVERLLDKQLLEEATRVIHDRALQAVSDREFGGAELLRDRILEINPMAMDDAISLGELIESKKGEDISDHYMAIWSELCQLLDEEEFRALYYACSMETYGRGEEIVRAGEMSSSLYFLNSGQVHLFCSEGEQEVFLKKLFPGDVSGWDPFFSASVWTVSLRAKGIVHLQVLEQEALSELEGEYPGISGRLEEFCRQRTRVPELLKMSGKDRRSEPRYSITLIARNMLLDSYGNKGKRTFTGVLMDISKTGLAFSVGISSTENAKALLGRQLITLLDMEDSEELRCKGAIVGVRKSGHGAQEFTVHVRLAQKIDNNTFEQLVANTV